MNIDRINVPVVQAVALVVAVIGMGVPLLMSMWNQQSLLIQIYDQQWTMTHQYLFERSLREANPQCTIPTTVEVDRLYWQLKRHRQDQ